MQSRLKELRTLKQEENALMSLASKVSDQLNRLKVEELALQNLIRLENDGLEGNVDEEDQPSDIVTKTEPMEEGHIVPLDLEVRTHHTGNDEEEEEEEEEEEDNYVVHEDLAQFVAELQKQTGS